MKLPDIRWFYKATVTKTLMVLAQKHIYITGTGYKSQKKKKTHAHIAFQSTTRRKEYSMEKRQSPQ